MTRTSFFTTIAAAAAAVVAKAQGIIITPGTTTFGPPTDGGVYKRKLTDTDRLDAIIDGEVMLSSGPIQSKPMQNPWDLQGELDGLWAARLKGDRRGFNTFYSEDPRAAIDMAIHRLEEE